jgi:hypothetical protein
MKDLITGHPLLVGFAFVAIALVLLGLAVRRLMFSGGGRTRRSGSTLVRSPRPADALATARPRISETEFNAVVTRQGAARSDHSLRTADSRPQPRPVAAEPAVLGLENQIDGLQDTLLRRVDALERRIEKVERQLDVEPGVDDLPWGPADRIDTPPTPSITGGAWDREYGRAGNDSVISQPIVSGPGSSIGGGWDVAAGGVGVEIRGSEVVASQSYPPEAYLTVRGGGVATVVLNPEVPHNSFALDRFALFFDLGERRDGMYQTQTPAEVKWDGQRGTLSRPGKAVAR